MRIKGFPVPHEIKNVFISFTLEVILEKEKKLNKEVWLFCSSFADFIFCLLVKLSSPDVRAFLQMDKIRNFSDASEDEDEKVRRCPPKHYGLVVYHHSALISLWFLI